MGRPGEGERDGGLVDGPDQGQHLRLMEYVRRDERTDVHGESEGVGREMTWCALCMAHLVKVHP